MTRILRLSTPLLAVMLLVTVGCGKRETSESAVQPASEVRGVPSGSAATPADTSVEPKPVEEASPAAEPDEEETAAAGSKAGEAAGAEKTEPSEKEGEMPEKPAKPKGTVVKVETNRGDIVIELADEYMPRTVSNFRRLVKQKFYDGLVWHRVEDWVVQTGDPTVTKERWKLWEKELERADAEGRQPRPIRLDDGEMWMPGGGGSGANVKFETSTKCTHDKGAVGLARSADPDSGSSQWYIVKRDAHDLDDEVAMKRSMGRQRGYACFGHVTEGMDVVLKLQPGDVVRRIRIVSEPKPGAGA